MSGSLTREEVQAYETQVRHLLGRLAQTYGPVTLDRIWNAELPQSGQVGDIRFWFHGTGGTARMGTVSISWDWQEDQRTLELDPWKVRQTLQSLRAPDVPGAEE
ncbi:DUF6896 domain-containing protein [Deinococcus ficus]|uniref:DUF6896 domain-containing protein n=1 Tax=Deinococcus ficus TaxID=317577 RepID=UPI0003B5982C|nr:hypothetical protein [Deinococcus ficus]